jgi:prepilin-type N-terminal cleavage/methylation domain-containing protein
MRHRNPVARPAATDRSRAGVTIMEMMIAVAISSLLLASVGIAIDASFKANTANQDQSHLTQRSRLAMNRIVTDIRGTVAHAPIDPQAVTGFEGGLIVSDTGIQMLVGDEETGAVVKYELDAAGKRLYYTDVNNKKHVAVSNVENFVVKFEPMKSLEAQQTGGVYDQLLRATVLLTIRPDKGDVNSDQTLTLSSSVMPRRNAW